MALSGLFLIVFLLVHVGLNSCIFNDLPIFNPEDDGSMFNRAAAFMGDSYIIRIIEIGLFAFFLLHIIQAYAVTLINRNKRKQGYQVSLGNRGSTWMSRNMAILGTLIFIYLVIHISQFWVPSRITGLEEVEYHGKQYHNLFIRMYGVPDAMGSDFVFSWSWRFAVSPVAWISCCISFPGCAQQKIFEFVKRIRIWL